MWTVCENQVGCLPESEPADFNTRTEAMKYAIEEMRQARFSYDLEEIGDEFNVAWQTLLGLQSSKSDVYVLLPYGRVLTVEETSCSRLASLRERTYRA